MLAKWWWERDLRPTFLELNVSIQLDQPFLKVLHQASAEPITSGLFHQTAPFHG